MTEITKETLAEEFSRLAAECHEGDDHTKAEAWNLLADFAVDNAADIAAALSLPSLDHEAGEAVAWTQPSVLALLKDDQDAIGSIWNQRDMLEARGFLCDPDMPDDIPLYAHPPVQPSVGVPVKVKPLEWKEDWGGSEDDIVEWRAKTPWGAVCASVAGCRDAHGKPYERHADVPEDLKAKLISESTAHYEARILSALSALSRDASRDEERIQG